MKRRVFILSIVACCGFSVGFLICRPLAKEKSIAESSLLETQSSGQQAAEILGSEGERVESYRQARVKTQHLRITVLNDIGNWISRDALSFVNSVHPSFTDSDYRGILGEPESVLNGTVKINDTRVKAKVFLNAYKELGDRYPIRALDLYGALPRTSIFYAEYLKLGEKLARNANPESMMLILRHQNTDKYLVPQIIKQWVKDDTESALSFLEKLDLGQIPKDRIDKSMIWFEVRNVGEAEVKLRYLEKMPQSRERDESIAASKGSILAENPSKWDSMFQTDDSKLLLGKIASDAAVKSVMNAPEIAAGFLSNIPTINEKLAATALVTRDVVSKSRKNPVVIENWLKNFKDPILIDAVVKEIRFQKGPVPKGY